ncbi:MAG: ParB/RepB/Spo0J family partition protein [Kiritimatiellae bacterium]|nr:ParB/RepB/Spo0J family partition protein [Kiritimatiellia bacterium]
MKKKNTKKQTGKIEEMNTIERKPIDISIDCLSLAPWNPRGEITEESVTDLIPTIKSQGLIQRIAVIADSSHQDGAQSKYIVIAGNRRLVACRAAGLNTVPCELFCGISQARARQLTLIENLKRKDAEPLYVAKVIQTLRDNDKLTMEEIAAEIGMPDSWVYRRAKLIDLVPEWREAVEDGKITATTDLLEKVSRYTCDIQKEALNAIIREYDTTARLTWNAVAREFETRVTDLDKAKFDRRKCANCPNNTACSPSLWDDLDGAKFGKCLDPKCFALKRSEIEMSQIKKLELDGFKVVKVKDFFSIPEDSFVAPTDTHRVACVYRDYNGEQAVRYAAKDPTEPETEKKSVNNTDKEREKALKDAIKRVKKWEEEEMDIFIKKLLNVSDDRIFAAYLFSLANAYGFINNWSLTSVDTGLRSLANSVLHDRDIKRERYVSALIQEIQDKEDSAAVTIRIFESANMELSPEERNLILRG